MNKIPKVIHYCWFGGNPLPSLAVRCIQSWKKYCPDYEIKEWNESNFDINLYTYTKEAYEAKKWAFVSDVARLYAVYAEGGVYLDVDVEVLKSLNELLIDSMFIGFENHEYINTGLGFGAEKKFYLVEKMLDVYDDMLFIKSDGKFNLTPCPVHNTEVMKQEGFLINNTKQKINNAMVYPTEYFCPKDGKTGIVSLSDNTYSIHHYDGSWLSDEQKEEYLIVTEYRKKYGRKLGEVLYAVVAILTFRTNGINNIIEKMLYKVKDRKKQISRRNLI